MSNELGTKSQINKPETIVGIGAEGGSITLYGCKDAKGDWHFARDVNDQTPMFLDEDDGDPPGGVLTTEQMIERDRIVFEAARASETPVAWNLAGGYQEPLAKVVELHVNTMRECVRVFGASEIGEAHAKGEKPRFAVFKPSVTAREILTRLWALGRRRDEPIARRAQARGDLLKREWESRSSVCVRRY